MNGQKHIFMFFMFLIFIFSFSFYKNVIRRDKELKRQREEDLKQKADLERKNAEKQMALEKLRFAELQRQQLLLMRMKEHADICYDIHAIIFRPEKEIALDSITNSSDESGLIMASETPPVVNQANLDQSKSKNSVVAEPIIYLFILVLIYSLVKAAMDISQHYQQQKADREGGSRRCSLKEYATHKAQAERRASKNIAQKAFVRRSTVMSFEARAKTYSKSFEERRLSRVISEIPTTGQITEPGSPAKFTTGLAIKPAPLLRRCSVPAFALQNMGPTLRRPSIDSFSEDDSSPDLKRRVRMIHRH